MKAVKKTRPSRVESRAITREKLLASAREIFARNGYSGASVELIAEAAGYSKGAFYSNFESKETLFLALLQEHRDKELSTFEQMLAHEDNIEHIFVQLKEYYAQLENDMDWGLLSAEFHIQAGRDPVFSKHIHKFYRHKRAAIGNLITQLFAKAHQPLPAAANELAAIFIGLAIGLSLQHGSDQTTIRKGLLGDAILLVLNSLLNNPTASK